MMETEWELGVGGGGGGGGIRNVNRSAKVF